MSILKTNSALVFVKSYFDAAGTVTLSKRSASKGGCRGFAQYDFIFLNHNLIF